MIEIKVNSLFECHHLVEARLVLCLRNFWLRGLINESSTKSWKSLQEFKRDLEWDEFRDEEWIDRDSWPLLGYASFTGCLELVRAVLMEIAAAKTTEDERLRCVRTRCPKRGFVKLGIVGSFSILAIAMYEAREYLNHIAHSYHSYRHLFHTEEMY